MADPIVVMSPAELRALLAEVIAETASATSKPPEPAPLMDRHGLAQLLDVSLSTVDRLIREGVPRVYVGDAPRFDRERVMAWLEAREGERRSPAVHAGTAEANPAENKPEQLSDRSSSCMGVTASKRKSAKTNESRSGGDLG